VLHMPEGALTREARIQVRSRQVPTVRGDSVIVAEAAVIGPRRLLKRKANLEILLPVPINSRPRLVVQQTTPGAAWKRVKVASRITSTDRHVRVAIDTIPTQVRAHFLLSAGAVHRPSVRPEIAFVAPSSLHEGETAAILLTGKNFVPGRTT